MLAEARFLEETMPSPPWNHWIEIRAAGVIAAGWTSDNRFVLISHDGYSINDPISGEMLHRDAESEATYDAMHHNDLRFRIPLTGEDIDIFGISAGDGIHTSDGWHLDVIYPWWPRPMVTLYLSYPGRVNFIGNRTAIKFGIYTDWIKVGFSPTGKHFAIIGSSGAEIHSKLQKKVKSIVL